MFRLDLVFDSLLNKLKNGSVMFESKRVLNREILANIDKWDG